MDRYLFGGLDQKNCEKIEFEGICRALISEVVQYAQNEEFTQVKHFVYMCEQLGLDAYTS